MRRLSDVYELQRSRDNNQMQMISYLKEPQDSKPFTEALIRLDWLFTTTSNTIIAHTHTHSAEALLLLVHVFGGYVLVNS